MTPAETDGVRKPVAAFTAGGIIGALGGLIGLGGAEFRLPLLIGLFSFPALEAVILNKTMSLIVGTTALPFRAGVVPLADLASQWPVIVNLLAGSLVGACFGAGWATGLRPETLHRVIGVLLLLIAGALSFGHGMTGGAALIADGVARIIVGVITGFGIGIVAALLGVAGGELGRKQLYRFRPPMLRGKPMTAWIQNSTLMVAPHVRGSPGWPTIRPVLPPGTASCSK